MTGRTHDLAAFTGLVIAFLYWSDLPPMTLPTVITALGANFVGGLFPDIDQPTSDFWDNFRLGPFVAKVVCPALGGHRHFSHSIAGVVFIAAASSALLEWVFQFVLLDIDTQIVWYAFMIGVVSHVLMDMPTKAGVPLLWPLDICIGFPPFRALRMESGKFMEKFVVFPGLLVLTGYLLYTHQEKVLIFIRYYLQQG